MGRMRERERKQGRERNAYMQAMLRMPTTAIFVRRCICKVRTRNIGNKPTVKSHNAANALYT